MDCAKETSNTAEEKTVNDLKEKTVWILCTRYGN